MNNSPLDLNNSILTKLGELEQKRRKKASEWLNILTEWRLSTPVDYAAVYQQGKKGAAKYREALERKGAENIDALFQDNHRDNLGWREPGVNARDEQVRKELAEAVRSKNIKLKKETYLALSYSDAEARALSNVTAKTTSAPPSPARGLPTPNFKPASAAMHEEDESSTLASFEEGSPIASSVEGTPSRNNAPSEPNTPKHPPTTMSIPLTPLSAALQESEDHLDKVSPGIEFATPLKVKEDNNAQVVEDLISVQAQKHGKLSAEDAVDLLSRWKLMAPFKAVSSDISVGNQMFDAHLSDSSNPITQLRDYRGNDQESWLYKGAIAYRAQARCEIFIDMLTHSYNMALPTFRSLGYTQADKIFIAQKVGKFFEQMIGLESARLQKVAVLREFVRDLTLSEKDIDDLLVLTENLHQKFGTESKNPGFADEIEELNELCAELAILREAEAGKKERARPPAALDDSFDISGIVVDFETPAQVAELNKTNDRLDASFRQVFELASEIEATQSAAVQPDVTKTPPVKVETGAVTGDLLSFPVDVDKMVAEAKADADKRLADESQAPTPEVTLVDVIGAGQSALEENADKAMQKLDELKQAAATVTLEGTATAAKDALSEKADQAKEKLDDLKQAAAAVTLEGTVTAAKDALSDKADQAKEKLVGLRQAAAEVTVEGTVTAAKDALSDKADQAKEKFVGLRQAAAEVTVEGTATAAKDALSDKAEQAKGKLGDLKQAASAVTLEGTKDAVANKVGETVATLENTGNRLKNFLGIKDKPAKNPVTDSPKAPSTTQATPPKTSFLDRFKKKDTPAVAQTTEVVVQPQGEQKKEGDQPVAAVTTPSKVAVQEVPVATTPIVAAQPLPDAGKHEGQQTTTEVVVEGHVQTATPIEVDPVKPALRDPLMRTSVRLPTPVKVDDEEDPNLKALNASIAAAEEGAKAFLTETDEGDQDAPPPALPPLPIAPVSKATMVTEVVAVSTESMAASPSNTSSSVEPATATTADVSAPTEVEKPSGWVRKSPNVARKAAEPKDKSPSSEDAAVAALELEDVERSMAILEALETKPNSSPAPDVLAFAARNQIKATLPDTETQPWQSATLKLPDEVAVMPKSPKLGSRGDHHKPVVEAVKEQDKPTVVEAANDQGKPTVVEAAKGQGKLTGIETVVVARSEQELREGATQLLLDYIRLRASVDGSDHAAANNLSGDAHLALQNRKQLFVDVGNQTQSMKQLIVWIDANKGEMSKLMSALDRPPEAKLMAMLYVLQPLNMQFVQINVDAVWKHESARKIRDEYAQLDAAYTAATKPRPDFKPLNVFLATSPNASLWLEVIHAAQQTDGYQARFANLFEFDALRLAAKKQNGVAPEPKFEVKTNVLKSWNSKPASYSVLFYAPSRTNTDIAANKELAGYHGFMTELTDYAGSSHVLGGKLKNLFRGHANRQFAPHVREFLRLEAARPDDAVKTLTDVRTRFRNFLKLKGDLVEVDENSQKVERLNRHLNKPEAKSSLRDRMIFADAQCEALDIDAPAVRTW